MIACDSIGHNDENGTVVPEGLSIYGKLTDRIPYHPPVEGVLRQATQPIVCWFLSQDLSEDNLGNYPAQQGTRIIHNPKH